MGDTQVVKGWQFPAHIDVPEDRFYRIQYGDNEEQILDWYGHVIMAHQLDLDGIETEIVDSGYDDTRYAAAKATIAVDGDTFSAIGGADATSMQVRDPEHVWSVAESRALKRAIKKAIPMVPASGDMHPDRSQTGDIEVDDSVSGPDVDVERKAPPPPASPPEDESLPERAKPAADDEDLDW